MNEIICGDSLEILKKLEDNSVDCIVTSPPYNKSFYDKRTNGDSSVWKQRAIKYGSITDDLPPEVYESQQRRILNELVRILKPSGSIFYNHKEFSFEHKLIFPKWVYDYNIRQTIIWDRGSTPQINPIRFYPTTEYIFWITKDGKQPYFNNEEVSHKTVVWRINPKPDKEHPAPFPKELVENCIKATTKKGDVVFDPYMGSGTVALVAQQLGRNYKGIEINPEYIEIAEERIKNMSNNLFQGFSD